MNYTNIKRLCISFFAILLLSAMGIAQEDLLNQEVTIVFDNISMKESLKKLEETSGVSTAYNEREITDDKVTLTFEKELLSDVLDALLANKELDYKVIGETVTIFKSKTYSQKKSLPKSSKKFTISGYIVDGSSKETLIGANVYIRELDLGSTSNEYGFYSLTLPEGDYDVTYSYIGYETMVKPLALTSNVVFSSTLYIGNELSEVIITADEVAQRHAESKMSTNSLSLDKLTSMPVLMGERDLIRLAQLMPGIQSGSEGSTGLYVRGGGPDQNLFLIDGVPIYNINHLFGFLSALNGDAIKTADVIKGGFPAHFGGRLSSIIDIRTKDGNMEEIHGDVTMGFVAGKFNIEGPLNKGKTSFNLSTRRTWLDLFTAPAQKIANRDKVEKEFTNYNFYDLNAKINHKFSDKSRLFLSSYLGDDHMRYRGEYPDEKEDGDLKWGNRIYSLRWNYQLSPKVFSNTTIYKSAYKKSFTDKVVPISTSGNTDYYASTSGINDYGAKIDVHFLPNPNHHIRLGIGGIYHTFSPTTNTTSVQVGTAEPEVNTTPVDKIKANELSAYIEDDIAIGSRLRINAGIHISDFIVENSNYFTIQPRVALSCQVGDRSSLKLSYSDMRQFIHLLASPGLGFPNDLWVTSTDRIKPEKSTQYAVGYTQSVGNGFEITVEGYYKTMKNLLEYKSGFGFFSSGVNWEDKVIVGDGESYGIELLVEKNIGKLTGWIGYTLSRSDRKFADLSRGNAFPYKYDRRHDISVALTHKKSERIDFGLIWVYGSGNTYTLGTQNYNAIGYGEDPPFATNFLSTLRPLNHIESRNNQRAPAYHRLDLSVNFHKTKKRGKRTWSLGLYNAYARNNPFQLQVAQRRDSGELYLKQTSLLSIVPFASYSFKF